jgi:hypothetical protein
MVFGQNLKGVHHFGFYLTYGHLHNIRQICSLIVQIWRGKSHFSQKRPLANLANLASHMNWYLANLLNTCQARLAGVSTSKINKLFGKCEYLPALKKSGKFFFTSYINYVLLIAKKKRKKDYYGCKHVPMLYVRFYRIY